MPQKYTDRIPPIVTDLDFSIWQARSDIFEGKTRVQQSGNYASLTAYYLHPREGCNQQERDRKADWQSLPPAGSCQPAEHCLGYTWILLECARQHAIIVQACLWVHGAGWKGRGSEQSISGDFQELPKTSLYTSLAHVGVQLCRPLLWCKAIAIIVYFATGRTGNQQDMSLFKSRFCKVDQREAICLTFWWSQCHCREPALMTSRARTVNASFNFGVVLSYPLFAWALNGSMIPQLRKKGCHSPFVLFQTSTSNSENFKAFFLPPAGTGRDVRAGSRFSKYPLLYQSRDLGSHTGCSWSHS